MSYTRKENETAILADGLEILIPHEEWKRKRKERAKKNLQQRQSRASYQCPPSVEIHIKKPELELQLKSSPKKNHWQKLLALCKPIFLFLFAIVITIYNLVADWFRSRPKPLQLTEAPELPSENIEITHRSPFTNEELRNMYRQANMSVPVKDEVFESPPKVSHMTFLRNNHVNEKDKSLDSTASKNSIPVNRGL